MLIMNIENTSGTDIAADDGTLPNSLSWFDLADTANINVVVQVHDLDKVEDNHSGFTVGDMLQQMVQAGSIVVGFTDVGATDVSVMDDAVATAA
jgi:hypothetical protein